MQDGRINEPIEGNQNYQNVENQNQDKFTFLNFDGPEFSGIN